MTPTQWELHNLCWKHGLQPREAINLFDEEGLISNQVVYFKDMADADCRKCIRFLNQKHQPKTS